MSLNEKETEHVCDVLVSRYGVEKIVKKVRVPEQMGTPRFWICPNNHKSRDHNGPSPGRCFVCGESVRALFNFDSRIRGGHGIFRETGDWERDANRQLFDYAREHGIRRWWTDLEGETDEYS